MTIGTLVLYIAIIALVLTGVILVPKKGEKHWVLSFLQNFCGVLFVVSGWVKAVDPMGTAFKMEQYFAEFEATFEGTWFGFLAPMFPWLAEQSIGFSVFMIVLEIVVGLMLIIGHKPKFTAWVFLITIIFFTILTGFTFLTGYVPTDANFFEFGKWTAYNMSNMRVTDCGCFGDFIKLEPRTSFYKDIVLLGPAILFVLRSKHMHQLLTSRVRNIFVGASVIALLIYCMSNYMWDLPHTDFRPFKKGVDIAQQRELELEAAGNRAIIAWRLKNKASGDVRELPNDEYMSNYKSYPSEEWEILEQVLEDPTVEPTKISDFEVLSSEGDDMTEEILNNPNPTLMVVCHKLKGKANYETGTYEWRDGYIEKFDAKVNPLLRAAREDGVEGFLVAGGASGDKLTSFRKEAEIGYPIYEADDILLKTIVRSNPGVVLLRNGVIIDKWHISKLPEWSEMREALQ